jgi:nitrogen fixation/metabolism regulation signal transduction histidine kinase
MFFVGIFIIFQIYSLIRYVEKTNRDLTRFFQSIRYSDFSQTFIKNGRGKSFEELNTEYNEVISKFRQARVEKEENFRFLQTIVQHVGIALLAYQQNGDVILINTPAKRLFKSAQLRNINSLKPFSNSLVEIMFRLKSGEKELVKVVVNNDSLQLMVYATEFKIRDQKITLVSIQDIRNELEEKEMEAWQNLIRVLTHEIMNSITPISSLASTVNDLVKNTYNSKNLDIKDNDRQEQISDIYEALQTIQKRSQGLLHFVDNYRDISNIPKPSFQIFLISELFERVIKLMQTDIDNNEISFKATIEPQSLELIADSELIEQVLINLILNSIQAVKGRKDARIDLEAGLDGRGNVIIKVIDNGSGIAEDVIDKIFIPFFTTKKNGSGIGLSLSRQIMRLHGGSISAFSKPNETTVFTLKF